MFIGQKNNCSLLYATVQKVCPFEILYFCEIKYLRAAFMAMTKFPHEKAN